jgi:hypothetical protein
MWQEAFDHEFDKILVQLEQKKRSLKIDRLKVLTLWQELYLAIIGKPWITEKPKDLKAISLALSYIDLLRRNQKQAEFYNLAERYLSFEKNRSKMPTLFGFVSFLKALNSKSPVHRKGSWAR